MFQYIIYIKQKGSFACTSEKKYSCFEPISCNRRNFTLSHFVTSNIQYQTNCQPITFFQLTPFILFPQINQVHAPLSPPLCSSSRPPGCQVQLGHPSPSPSQSGLSGFFSPSSTKRLTPAFPLMGSSLILSVLVSAKEKADVFISVSCSAPPSSRCVPVAFPFVVPTAR